MPGRVQHPELGDPAPQDLAVDQVEIGILVRVHVVPQHPVVGMQQDRRVDRVLERDRGVDVVVVPVRERDRRDSASVDRKSVV